MCTLSYLLTADGYQLFFNRDEQRSRPTAIAPQYDAKLSAVYPIDPQGNGTWLAVRQDGTSLALLNYYQGTQPKSGIPLLSRGQIILSLLPKSAPQNLITEMDCRHYAPFQLLIFPDNLTQNSGAISRWIYNGEQLVQHQPESPITSSGVDFIRVQAARLQKYQQLQQQANDTSELLKQFHYSTEQEGKLSVKMQRSDARTVSISHICVSDHIRFSYHDLVHNRRYQQHLMRQQKHSG